MQLVCRPVWGADVSRHFDSRQQLLKWKCIWASYAKSQAASENSPPGFLHIDKKEQSGFPFSAAPPYRFDRRDAMRLSCRFQSLHCAAKPGKNPVFTHRSADFACLHKILIAFQITPGGIWKARGYSWQVAVRKEERKVYFIQIGKFKQEQPGFPKIWCEKFTKSRSFSIAMEACCRYN